MFIIKGARAETEDDLNQLFEGRGSGSMKEKAELTVAMRAADAAEQEKARTSAVTGAELEKGSLASYAELVKAKVVDARVQGGHEWVV